MRILVSGSSGLVGTQFVAAARSRGDVVVRLTRDRGADPEQLFWDPARGQCDDVRGFDAVVHLAGENIADGRWTDEKKQRIRDSRVDGTRLLAERLARSSAPPRVFVSTSATGIYGDRGDEVLDESSPPGSGFLADVARAWEKAADPARQAGIRVVHPRLGMVLAREGGALPRMLTPFRLGVGGKIGSGEQYWSWITLRDVVGVMLYAIDDPELVGPINTVAPEPCTNRQFTKTLGSAIARPTIFPLPKFAARLVMGRELADALLLASTRVVPTALRGTDFSFRDATLESALRQLLHS